MEAYTNLGSDVSNKIARGTSFVKQHLTRDLAGLVRRLQVEAVATASQHPSGKITEQIASAPVQSISICTGPTINVVVIKFKGNQKHAVLNELIAEFGQGSEQDSNLQAARLSVVGSEDPDN